MMYFDCISYLKFLLTSTNAHGVHSPFVFSYVTQCLYAPLKIAKPKALTVLLKSIAYFKTKNIHIQGNILQPNKKYVKRYYPNLVWGTHCLDMLYTDRLSPTAFDTLLAQGKLHNDSVIFITSPYESREKHQGWKTLIAAPKITVSLDMFYLGALFIRKEQEKEHFTLRI